MMILRSAAVLLALTVPAAVQDGVLAPPPGQAAPVCFVGPVRVDCSETQPIGTGTVVTGVVGGGGGSAGSCGADDPAGPAHEAAPRTSGSFKLTLTPTPDPLMVTVGGGGEVRIDWKAVDAAAADPATERSLRSIARIMTAICDRTWKPMGAKP
jgi:hypothetical protein